MAEKNRIGYICILGVMLLTLIPFISRLSLFAAANNSATNNCHKSSMISDNIVYQHSLKTKNTKEWTSACKYCELFIHLPVLIYQSVIAIKSFRFASIHERIVIINVVIKKYSYTFIRAPPIYTQPKFNL